MTAASRNSAQCIAIDLRPLDTCATALSHLLLKYINIGHFPAISVSQDAVPNANFFPSVLPEIRRRSESPNCPFSYSQLWSLVLASLPSPSFRTLFLALLATLPGSDAAYSTSRESRLLVSQNARLLKCLVGPVESITSDLWEVISVAFLDSSGRSEAVVRVAVCWIAGNNNVTGPFQLF